MKTIIIKLFLLFVLVYASISLLSLFTREELDPDNYLAATIDKHERLNSLQSPKIIFVGDSSLVFGLDAKRIEEELHMPVSNMGLHAALGLEFTFRELGDTIHKNDVVVLVSHYYPNDEDINQGVICHTLDFYPSLKQKIVHNPLDGIRLDIMCNIKRMRRYLVIKHAQLVSSSLDTVTSTTDVSPAVFQYARSSFTPYGDIVDILYEHSEVHADASSPDMVRTSQHQTMSDIRAFSTYVHKQGAFLYFVYPPYPESKYAQNVDRIGMFADMLQHDTDMKILGVPRDTVFSDELFFNSDYHVTSFGKREYTDKVIELLENIIVEK